MSEQNTVLAVRRGRFGFIEKWGFLTWLIAVVLMIATGGIWLFVIIGWHYDDILLPKYYCNQCDAEVPKRDFRA